MKKIIGASVIVLVVLIIFAVSFFYSQKYSILPSDPLNAIPTDAAYIFELPNGKDATGQLTSSGFYKKWQKVASFSSMSATLNRLDSVFRNEPFFKTVWTKEKLLISTHLTKANDFDFLFACNIPARSGESEIKRAVEQIAEEGMTFSKREYENVNIYEWTKGKESVFTIAFSKGILLTSKTAFLVEAGIRQVKSGISIKKSKPFSKIRSKKQGNISVYFNLAELQNLFNGYLAADNEVLNTSFASLAKWAGFELSLKANHIDGYGFMATTDSSNLISAFEGQKPSPSQLPLVLSSRTAFFMELNGSNVPEIMNRIKNKDAFFNQDAFEKEKLNTISEKIHLNLNDDLRNWIGSSVALVITEPGTTVLDNTTFAYIAVSNTKNLERTIQKIQRSAGDKTNTYYKNHRIGTMSVESLTPLWFGKLFSSIRSNAFALINDHLIFSNQLSNIKSLIDDIENHKTFSSSAEFSDIGKNTFAGNLNVFMDCAKSDNVLLSGGNLTMASALENNRPLWNTISAVAISLRSEKEKSPARLRITFSSGSEQKMNLLWAAQLDTNLHTSPCLLYGNNGNFIVVQDKINQLYLFDDAGRLIWKKQISEPVIGSMYNVDYYRNGGTQIVFNTSSSIYMLDLKGNAVGSYPVHLPAPAANGLTLADLTETGKPNILIGCENGLIYSYELSGKPFSEWLFNKFIPTSGESVVFSKAANEKQLLFRDTKGKIYACDIKGRTSPVRIELNEKYPILPLQNSATSLYAGMNNSGQLIIFNSKEIIHSYLRPDSITSFALSGKGESCLLLAASDDTLYILNNHLEMQEEYPLTKGNYHISIDPANSDYSALIDQNVQEVSLLSDKGEPNKSLQAKGWSSIRVIPSTKPGTKNKMLTSDNESGIYFYSY